MKTISDVWRLMNIAGLVLAFFTPWYYESTIIQQSIESTGFLLLWIALSPFVVGLSDPLGFITGLISDGTFLAVLSSSVFLCGTALYILFTTATITFKREHHLNRWTHVSFRLLAIGASAFMGMIYFYYAKDYLPLLWGKWAMGGMLLSCILQEITQGQAKVKVIQSHQVAPETDASSETEIEENQ